MQFELINERYLRISSTRTLSYRDRLLNIAIFLQNFLVRFNNSYEHNEAVRSVCFLLPFLLGNDDPFLARNTPHRNGRRESNRIARLSLYSGVGIIERKTSAAAAHICLETTGSLRESRDRVQRSAASSMARYIARLQTPLFHGSADFQKFLRVWTHHCESMVDRSFRRLPLGPNLNMELVHLGGDIMDLLFGHNLHDVRRLHRIALRFNRIYGESVALDVLRLAHFPRTIHIQNWEEYLHGSQLQKELRGGETS
ncbi:P0 [Tobacco polerovirus 2]|nr:P0 [Tobacco polerovirus 2]UKD40721.1 P0 [Tobacco polerovirus 2]